ncbi:MAG: hypothetical protein ABI548_03920 [Polyangiaceae bacterium]
MKAQPKDELAWLIRDIDRKSKACLRDSIACIQENVGTPALAVLFQQAKPYGEAFRANEPSVTMPPEVAKVYRAAAGRYTQAALNFYREWQRKTIEAVRAKLVKLDETPLLFDRLNVEHAKQSTLGVVPVSAESEWLEWRIAHSKLVLDGLAENPPTAEERHGVLQFASRAVAEVRANRERWSMADAHPHPIMLSDLLADVMQAVVDKAAIPAAS